MKPTRLRSPRRKGSPQDLPANFPRYKMPCSASRFFSLFLSVKHSTFLRLFTARQATHSQQERFLVVPLYTTMSRRAAVDCVCSAFAVSSFDFGYLSSLHTVVKLVNRRVRRHRARATRNAPGVDGTRVAVGGTGRESVTYQYVSEAGGRTQRNSSSRGLSP